MNGHNRKRINSFLAILALAAMLPAAGWAAKGPAGNRPLGPPPEAVAACEGKSIGDAVQFTNRRGQQVEGICREIDGKLVGIRAERGERFGGGKGCRNGQSGPALGRLATQLDLTENQQEQIRQIFTAEREKIAPLLEKKRSTREQIRAAVHSAQADEKALRDLAAAQAQIQADLLVARAAAWKQVQTLLTPEQQEKAQTLPNSRGGKGGCRACR